MNELNASIAGIFSRYVDKIKRSEKGVSSFEPGAWEELTQELLLLKFPEVERQNLERRSAIERSESPLVDINDLHSSKIFLDLYHIEIISFYPTIIKKFIKQGIMNSNPHTKIVSYLIDLRNDLKKMEHDGFVEKGISIVCKMWINYFYGKMESLNMDSSLISGEARRIMENIRYMIFNSWIYIDTDEIIFKGTTDNLFSITSYLKDIGISSEYSTIEWGIFFGKKKYIYVKDGVLTSKGFKYSE
jgi:hypothetical protein